MNLIGKTIAKMYRMDDRDMKVYGWEKDFSIGYPVIIEFTDGSTIYATSDSEGNNFGVLQWVDATNDAFGTICTDQEGTVKVVCTSE